MELVILVACGCIVDAQPTSPVMLNSPFLFTSPVAWFYSEWSRSPSSWARGSACQGTFWWITAGWLAGQTMRIGQQVIQQKQRTCRGHAKTSLQLRR